MTAKKSSKTKKITEKQLRVLQEIGDEGAKTASLALKQMFKQDVQTIPARVQFMKKSDLKKIYKTKEALTAVFFNISGGIDATMIDLYTRSNVLKLVDILMGKPEGTTLFVGEMGQSAIKEASNILSSSFLTAFSKLINTQLSMNTPSLAFNLESALDDYSIFGAKNITHAFVIETEFRLKEVVAVGKILALLDKKSVETLSKIL